MWAMIVKNENMLAAFWSMHVQMLLRAGAATLLCTLQWRL